MFVLCTALLYEQNSNNIIVHNSIEHFLCNPSHFFSDNVLSCLWIVFTNSVFQVPPREIGRLAEILGMGWPGLLVWYEMSLSNGKLCLRYSSVLFKVVVWDKVVPHFLNRTLEYLRHNFPWDRLISRQTNNPWSFYSHDLKPPDYFHGGTWKTGIVKITHRQERTSLEEKSDGFHKKCSIELRTILMFKLLLCCHTAARCMEWI